MAKKGIKHYQDFHDEQTLIKVTLVRGGKQFRGIKVTDGETAVKV